MMSVEKAEKVVAGIIAAVGDGVHSQSSVADGLAKQLEGRRWGTILEIGTLRGLSSAVLACFAETVFTIDVEENADRPKIYAALDRDIRNRICSIVVPDNDAKVLLVRALPFDFAFIDAGHTEGQVAIDFSLTRKCGEMLFHDYPASGSGKNGVSLVLDALTEGKVTACKPFAWWRAKE
jgi:hypothetical protein